MSCIALIGPQRCLLAALTRGPRRVDDLGPNQLDELRPWGPVCGGTRVELAGHYHGGAMIVGLVGK